MVYKKYIKRGGKIFGPYLYKSIKKDGKVITKYIGAGKDFNEKKERKFNKNTYNFLFLSLLIIFAVFLLFFINNKITGKITLLIDSDYEPGEQITGDLKIILKYGELIPASSKLVINNDGDRIEYILSELVFESVSEGSFYTENIEISGAGAGYGVLGQVEVYPEIDFTLKVIKPSKETQQGTEKEEISEEEVITEMQEEQATKAQEKQKEEKTEKEKKEQVTEIAQEQGTATEQQTPTTEEQTSQEAQPETSSEETTQETPLITGEAVSENVEEIHGKVSKNNPFTYTIEEGKTAELISPNENLKVEIKENNLIVSTEYTEIEEGFGEKYVIGNKYKINVNLDKLNLTAQKGEIRASLYYNDIELASTTKNIVIKEKTEKNETKKQEKNFTYQKSERANITEAINITETNITIANETITNVTEINLTAQNIIVSTIQYSAVLGKPVKWKKKIQAEIPEKIEIEIPLVAENVSVFKISEGVSEEIQETQSETAETTQEEKTQITAQIITGKVSLEFELDNEKSIITRFFRKIIRAVTGAITGRAVDVQKTQEIKQVIIEENATEFEIEYETPAPAAFEADISNGKEIIISGPEEIHYENVLAFTELPREIPINSLHTIKLYHVVEETINITDAQSVNNEITASATGQVISSSVNELNQITNIIKTPVNFNSYDTNNNSLIDYIEWLVPSLSNQTYELIIEITKAEHLDSNRTFISDIYEQVKALDGNWSEAINENEYVRVTFEIPLDNTRDITLYPRTISGTSKIEVYEINENNLIAEFTNIIDNQYNKVYLTNLNGTQDVFDLKIIGGSVEFEHIIDPASSYNISFVAPTPANNSYINKNYTEINVSITNAPDLAEVKFNWNGTNFTIYNDSLVLFMNFDNRSALGENSTYVVDLSKYSNNGTIIGNPIWNSTGKFAGAYEFDGAGDYVNTNIKDEFDSMISMTAIFWVYAKGSTYNMFLLSDYDISGDISATDVANIHFFITPALNLTIQHINIDGSQNFQGFTSGDKITLNNWNHIVLWRNSSHITFYINGVQDSGGYRSYIAADRGTTSQNTFKIGVNAGNLAAFFNGTIDDVMIWNRTLTASEVQQLYYSSLTKYDSQNWSLNVNQSNLVNGNTYTYQAFAKDTSGNENQTEVRTLRVNLNPPNSPTLNAPTNNSFTNLNWTILNTTIIDPEGDNMTVYIYASNNSNDVLNNTHSLVYIGTSIANGSTITYNLTSLPIDPSGAFKNGLVALYHFDNLSEFLENDQRNVSNSVYDFSGNSNNGTIGDSTSGTNPAWNASAGKFAGAFNFDATDDIIKIKNGNGVSVGNNFTFSVWIKPIFSKLWGIVIGQNGGNALFTESSGFINFYDNANCRSGVKTAEQWYFVTGVRNDTNLTLYINGVKENECRSDGIPWIILFIGSRGVEPGDDFNGSIDEVAIWNRTLSNAEILDLYRLGEGKYYWKVNATDSGGLSNVSETREFSVDTGAPSVSITYPQNTTYNINVSALNYTVSDANLQACWYSLDNGATNTTITCGTNATGLTSNEGSNTWSVYANDSANNLNTTSITFSKDTTPPAISIITPTSGRITSDNKTDVNYTVSDANLQACWYSNDTMTLNTTLTCGQNITTITWSNGQHNVTIWANDTLGNKNSSSVSFTIDTNAPVMDFGAGTQSAGAVVGNNWVYINISVTEENEDTIIFKLFNSTYGSINSSSFTDERRTINWTGLTDGIYYYNVSINDTVGASSTTDTRRITLDTTAPSISLSSPANAYSSTSTSVTFQYTVIDTQDVSCTLILDGGNVNLAATGSVDISGGTNTFTNTTSVASHTWSISCTDLTGNTGTSSQRSFTITSSGATTTTSGGGGGGGVATAPEINFNLDKNSLEKKLVVNRVEFDTFNIENNEDAEKIFKISVVALENIIDIEQAEIKVPAGETAKFRFKIIAPEKPGIYTGKIIVTSGNTREEILVVINIKTEKSLYDVVLSIPRAMKTINTGGNIFSQIDLLQMGIKEKMDVTLNYVVKDFFGNVILEESETIAVDGQKTLTKEFSTQELEPGDYVLGIEVIYPDGVAVASSQFKVKGKFEFTEIKIIIAIIAVILVASIIAILIRINRYKKRIAVKLKR